MSDDAFRSTFRRLMEENKKKTPEELTEEFKDDSMASSSEGVDSQS